MSQNYLKIRVRRRCGFDQREPGRQNSAEWIRTAYHDMSTADVDAGTGGLDASIMFETGREENKGDAINNMFSHLSAFYTVRSSAADLLAMAVVGSMAICGGYEVPLRVGRVDAIEAGPMGVPEPQQDLATHTAKFAKQGFNQSEMIELVACGHTLGGIHGANFPEITYDNSTGQVSTFEFNRSNVVFDNTVVKEYLASKTSNLLVDVMTRMIDTVPKDVVLSEPLKPIPIKPYVNVLALNSNGTIDFSGTVRVHSGKNTAYLNADDLSAYLTYKDRSGKNWTTTLDPEVGISGFHIHLTTTSTNTTEVFDNAGNTYPVSDTVLYQMKQSCSAFTANGAVSDGQLTVTAAVRKDAVSDKKVNLHFAKKVPRQGVLLDRFETQIEPFVAIGKAVAGYELYKVDKMYIDGQSSTTSFDIVIGDKVEVEFERIIALSQQTCAEL
ncbi:heme peroxidase [Byssothecium circinans]|uniref:Peroxidase n=1 Tax=Byssothecium circinans TaxID=147558 RepID=A0A6A5TXR9_9PLEO|nr:heme peroxidase [Byssothecium circinans]